jgi:hypothetical protein
VGSWIAGLLLVSVDLYTAEKTVAARAAELYDVTKNVNRLKEALHMVLQRRGQARAEAVAWCSGNASSALAHVSNVVNGVETTAFGQRLPSLPETSDEFATTLFNAIVYDTCAVLSAGSAEHSRCQLVHTEGGLDGLHSLTTALLADAQRARSTFSADNGTDQRTIAHLNSSGVTEDIEVFMDRFVRRATVETEAMDAIMI